jgi:glycosyltransferase involved in cell wall biosynthesis
MAAREERRAAGVLKVLHVVESFGSGTSSAVIQYVRSTPHVEHHLLRRIRTGDHIPEGEDELFATVHEMPARNAACVRSVRQAVRRISPDVIHGHSSLGGLFSRLAVRSRPGRRVVYTPHCFGFERRDVGGLARRALRTAEWLLALNTHTVAGCSRGEVDAVSAWRSVRRAVYVPNVAPGSGPSSEPDGHDDVVCLTVGRVSSQKDPGFFAQAAAIVSAKRPTVTFRWVGDGDQRGTDVLDRSGVEVTGWRTRTAVYDELRRADVYVHSAAWEGFPVSVLEAATMGLPVVARRIRAFAGAPDEWLSGTPDGLAASLLLLTGPEGATARRRNVDAWRAFLSDNTEEAQARQLMLVYSPTA